MENFFRDSPGNPLSRAVGNLREISDESKPMTARFFANRIARRANHEPACQVRSTNFGVFSHKRRTSKVPDAIPAHTLSSPHHNKLQQWPALPPLSPAPSRPSRRPRSRCVSPLEERPGTRDDARFFANTRIRGDDVAVRQVAFGLAERASAPIHPPGRGEPIGRRIFSQNRGVRRRPRRARVATRASPRRIRPGKIPIARYRSSHPDRI
jgi:hypothetical protein